MKDKWFIDKNHLAIENGNSIIHPDASEIFAFIDDAIDDTMMKGLTCGNPRMNFEHIRFSKVGSPVKCEISNDLEKGGLLLRVYTLRHNDVIEVDIVNGVIIDHCIANNEWFYLTGNIQELNDLFVDAGINEVGRITVRQYINISKYEYLNNSQLIENHVNIDKIEKIVNSKEEVPIQLHANLYPYQKIGYLWMKNMINESGGCILGDEMGLGKTLQILTLMLNLVIKSQVPILIVAPVSLLENWKRECQKFTPNIKIFVHHGRQRTGRYQALQEHDVVIISYNTAVSDLSMLSMIDWRLVVVDEAQNIKNPYSDRAKTIKKIPRRAGIAVTGTPFENHITDVWSLIDFVLPGMLGNIERFKSVVSDDIFGAQIVEPMLSPVMIRRMVSDVANDLPEKVIIPHPIVMSESECTLYRKYREEAKQKMENKSYNLPLLQNLRMFCTHPSLCDASLCELPPDKISIKYEVICDILEEIILRNEKAIIFTSYKKMFDIFLKDIPKRFDISVDVINGETPIELRQCIVDKFNDCNDSSVLVLNPRAAGTGLNITGANHVIHYNLEWNPALEDQSSARAYRRGQKKTVFVHRLYYVNTVEQVVNERIERKRDIAESLVVGTDGDESFRKDLLRALEMVPQFM